MSRVENSVSNEKFVKVASNVLYFVMNLDVKDHKN